jgi:hypothetical protein
VIAAETERAGEGLLNSGGRALEVSGKLDTPPFRYLSRSGHTMLVTLGVKPGCKPAPCSFHRLERRPDWRPRTACNREVCTRCTSMVRADDEERSPSRGFGKGYGVAIHMRRCPAEVPHLIPPKYNLDGNSACGIRVRVCVNSGFGMQHVCTRISSRVLSRKQIPANDY